MINVYLFLGLICVFNLLLAFFVQLRSYRRGLRIPLAGLAFLLPFNAAVGYWVTQSTRVGEILNGTKFFLALNIFVHFFLIELITNFFNESGLLRIIRIGRIRIYVRWIWRIGIPVIICCCFIPGFIITHQTNGQVSIIFSNLTIPLAQLILPIYAMYSLENTYRFSEKYQRKIGRLAG